MNNLTTALFYVGIYCLGIFCVLPFSKKVPFRILASTGFVWGLLIWSMSSTLALIFNLSFNWISMGLLVGAVFSGALIWNIKSNSLRMGLKDTLTLLAGVVITSLLAFILTQKSYIYTTADSFSIIYHGYVLGKSGLVPWSINQFTEWGLITPVIQMASQLLPGDYLTGYQVMLTTSLGMVFTIEIFLVFQKYIKTIPAFILSAMILYSLDSIMMVEHTFYLHSNMTAAVLLFIGLYIYWNYLREGSPEWLVLATIAMAGFGLSRIEGPLYVMFIQLLVISVKKLDYKHILWTILPSSGAFLLWYGYLYFSANQPGVLDKFSILIIISSLVLFSVLAILSHRIPRVVSLLPKLSLAILAGGLAAAFLMKPEHMAASTASVFINLSDQNSWGLSWIIAAAFLPLIFSGNPEQPENDLYRYGIAGYVIIVLLLGFARIPYRLGATDSANRLLLQIQPVVYMFIALKTKTLKEWIFSR